MSRSASIVIGDDHAAFIEREVAAGRYGSASDVVQAGLSLLEEQQAQVDALRSALIEGETSGPATTFDFEAFIARKRGGASSYPSRSRHPQ